MDAAGSRRAFAPASAS